MSEHSRIVAFVTQACRTRKDRAQSIIDACKNTSLPLVEAMEIARYAWDEEDSKEEPPTFTAVSNEELQQMAIPDRTILMREGPSPLFYASSINQIVAWRGVGKTNFALGLANALCGSSRILDFEADRPCRVLYVDGELPRKQLQERAKLLCPDSNGRLTLFGPEFIQPQPRSLNLLSRDGEGVKLLARRTKADVIILDSQATLMRGDKLKNTFEDARQNLLMDLRLMGLCIIELHHAGKDGRQRNRSNNDDLLDLQLMLKPVDDNAGNNLIFEMEVLKVRHSALISRGYLVRLIDGQWLKMMPDVDPRIQTLLEEGKSERAIADLIGVDRQQVRTVKKKLDLAKLNLRADAQREIREGVAAD